MPNQFKIQNQKPIAYNEFVCIKKINSGLVALGDNFILEGIIISMGEEVKGLKKGDKVAFNTVKMQIHKDYIFIPFNTIICKL